MTLSSAPSVSVIIPVYKVERYLRDCVRSVVMQDYGNIQIILVDDGSPDSCPSICDSLASEYTNVQVMHKKNGGLSDARNCGIDRADGEYMLFLDSDDTLCENVISDLVWKAVDSDADLVIPDKYIQTVEATGKVSYKTHFSKMSFRDNPSLFAIEVIIGKGRGWRASGLLYRAAVIRDYGVQFPVGYIAEDVVFNLSFLAKARKLALYEKPTLRCLKRPGSITTSFQENLADAFLLIDSRVRDFLVETNENGEFGDRKRKELLCRNAIIYVTHMLVKGIHLPKQIRYRKINDFLDLDVVKEAFSVPNISPYFESVAALLYFRIMFSLIRTKRRKIAFCLAEMSGRIG